MRYDLVIVQVLSVNRQVEVHAVPAYGSFHGRHQKVPLLFDFDPSGRGVDDTLLDILPLCMFLDRGLEVFVHSREDNEARW